ncbi:flagellin N-terminal helical domain-containing protein [Alicyclobacillus kakegawensis]|uniref:flagellin N-terminal helical domain-containing protein n=1 Tax=Alicyclobacillus kakegawensis TaxID=392012 RepID=UPI00082E6373|nr:flagellin [Alicyclobacillus kakegawensis]
MSYGLIINHNLGSMNALAALSQNQNSLQKVLQQLSTGKRINSAADDAAGLAISQKMQAQINGLDQSSRNAQDGISLIQTAEGALNETQSILQRMRQLADQSANGTYTPDDRNAMQLEINQLKQEVDRIANTTQFNTKNLLDGSIGNSAVLSTDSLNLKSVSVTDANLAADTYTVTSVSPATVSATVNTNTTGLNASTDFDFTDTSKVTGLALGNYTLTVTAGASSGTYDLTLQDANGVTVASTSGWDNTAPITLTGTNESGVSTKFTINNDANLQAGTMTFNLNATYGANNFTITNSAGKNIYSNTSSLTITDSNFQAGGFQFNMTVDSVLAAANSTSTITTTNNALTMQIGANANQTMKVGIQAMDATSLGINNIDISTQQGAETAITALDNAIQTVSSERSTLGAYQNRLEHTINNLSTESQNLATAQSGITDTDMASAMAEFTKDNVLQQAAVSMLAQANQQPQLVLKLLG